MSLRQGLIITNGSFTAFFTGHPIAVALMIVALVLLSLPALRALRQRSRLRTE